MSWDAAVHDQLPQASVQDGDAVADAQLALQLRQSLVAAVGLVLSVGAGVAMQRLVYSVGVVDAPTLAVVMAVMVAVVLIATLGPALRASRTSPITPLRAE